jgi:hypothetical protein
MPIACAGPIGRPAPIRNQISETMMMNGTSLPKHKPSAVPLAPGHKWRVYTRAMVEETQYFIKIFEGAVTVREGGEMNYVDEEAWEVAGDIRADMLQRITINIDIAGFELRNGFGKLVFTIQGAAEPSDGEISPSNIWLYHTRGIMNLEDLLHNLNENHHYLCLPACDNYGDRAMAEAFRARLGAWGVFPPAREKRVPPAGIICEPEP